MGKINELKEKIRVQYKATGSIWCPAVKDNVLFNHYGFSHLTHDSTGHRRPHKEIELRLHLVLLASEVIKKAKSIIQFPDGKYPSTIIIKGKQRPVVYYEIAHYVQSQKEHVTVILRRIEEGKLHYYSVRRTRNKIKK